MSITLSRNEIRAEVEKAIRGVGMAWGQAKDGGVMAAWMAAHDLPFLGALNKCLEAVDQDQDDLKAADVIAPFGGVMLAEFVAASKADWSGQVLMPRFLAAGLGLVASEQQVKFTMMIDGQVVMIADHDQISIDENGLASGLLEVTITLEDRDHHGLQPCLWSDQIAHQASLKCWQKLNQFASRTYVPETEEKRKAGAGAGDIDNS